MGRQKKNILYVVGVSLIFSNSFIIGLTQLAGEKFPTANVVLLVVGAVVLWFGMKGEANVS